jgi:hypothetical protein
MISVSSGGSLFDDDSADESLPTMLAMATDYAIALLLYWLFGMATSVLDSENGERPFSQEKCRLVDIVEPIVDPRHGCCMGIYFDNIDYEDAPCH